MTTDDMLMPETHPIATRVVAFLEEAETYTGDPLRIVFSTRAPYHPIQPVVSRAVVQWCVATEEV